MACMNMTRTGETLAERMTRAKRALKTLEQKLTAGQVRLAIAPNGAVAFAGWQTADREDLSDVCAYRTLTAESSWALRQAVARAEVMGGRKVNVQAVASGAHSHDGGHTWHRGH